MFTGKSFRFSEKIAAALVFVCLAGSAVAAPARPPTFRDRTARVNPAPPLPHNFQFVVLPLERSGQNHLLVRALINGRPALLGVDSGAPVSAISLTRVAHFGVTPVLARSEIPTRLQINGKYNSVAIARNLQLGSLSLVNEPMVAVDLSSTSLAAKLMQEQAIDGIIGADILFPTRAVLDCRAQTLTLNVNPSGRGTAPGRSYFGFVRVPMEVSSGYNLYVNGKVNGTKAKLMVDTGAYTTLLHRPFVREMNIPLRKTRFSSSGVNFKRRGVQAATISHFSIGSLNLVRKEVGVIDLGGLVRGGLLGASPPVAGLLGSEILQHHNGIIDFGTCTLYLKKNNAVARPLFTRQLSAQR